jgi:hypothetical protein
MSLRRASGTGKYVVWGYASSTSGRPTNPWKYKLTCTYSPVRTNLWNNLVVYGNLYQTALKKEKLKDNIKVVFGM